MPCEVDLRQGHFCSIIYTQHIFFEINILLLDYQNFGLKVSIFQNWQPITYFSRKIKIERQDLSVKVIDLICFKGTTIRTLTHIPTRRR